jgi:signal transduction histidine kinase
VRTNIIDNAMAAMRDTGGTLTIRTSRERENMARIEICDRTVSPRRGSRMVSLHYRAIRR